MELLQLTYFCSAAETENFSKTANQYLVPTSNISQTIKRLEKELGLTLFTRTANRITLNENGKKFYSQAKRALEILESAKNELMLSNTEKNEIRLFVHTGRRIVTSVVQAFKQDYPNVSFSLHHSYGDVPYDFIIGDVCKDPTFTEKELLVQEEILLALHKNHPLAKKDEICADDIRGERFIAMSEGGSMRRIFDTICNRENLNPCIVMQNDDPNAIKKYLHLGLGLSFIPSISWKDAFTEEIVFKKFGDYTRATYVYYNKRTLDLKTNRALLQKLKEIFKEESL